MSCLAKSSFLSHCNHRSNITHLSPPCEYRPASWCRLPRSAPWTAPAAPVPPRWAPRLRPGLAAGTAGRREGGHGLWESLEGTGHAQVIHLARRRTERDWYQSYLCIVHKNTRQWQGECPGSSCSRDILAIGVQGNSVWQSWVGTPDTVRAEEGVVILHCWQK